MNSLVQIKDKQALKTIDRIINVTSDEEKQQLLEVLNELIDIRQKEISKSQKIREASKLLKKSKATLPLIKNIKALVWDNRSVWTKIGVGLVTTVAVLSPGNAGIAALGGAIGVPLWVVVGGGYSFAVLLAEKLKNSLQKIRQGEPIDADYTTIL